jgi:hypothetical protein
VKIVFNFDDIIINKTDMKAKLISLIEPFLPANDEHKSFLSAVLSLLTMVIIVIGGLCSTLIFMR